MELSKYEYAYLRKIEQYLNVEFTDFDKRRMLSFLSDYIEDMNKLLKEELKSDEEQKQEPDKIFDAVIPVVVNPEAITKQLLMPNDLERDMQEFCKLVEADYNFIMKNKKKQGGMVTRVRSAFSRKMMNKYIMKTNDLADFFDVHYSTIHYYLYNNKNPHVLIPKSRKKN